MPLDGPFWLQYNKSVLNKYDFDERRLDAGTCSMLSPDFQHLPH